MSSAIPHKSTVLLGVAFVGQGIFHRRQRKTGGASEFASRRWRVIHFPMRMSNQIEIYNRARSVMLVASSSSTRRPKKQMNRIFSGLASALLLATLLVACTKGDSPSSTIASDPLVGEFGIAQKGKIAPAFRVEKTDAGYIFSYEHKGSWEKSSQVAQKFPRELFEELMKSKTDESFTGLVDRVIMFAKVKPGFTAGNFKTSTGYMIIIMMGGPIEVVKM